MLRRRNYTNLLYHTVLCLGAFVLRVLFLGRKNLWLDEAASFWLAWVGYAVAFYPLASRA